jgi:alkylated DNA repair dioxygenase AlkB
VIYNKAPNFIDFDAYTIVLLKNFISIEESRKVYEKLLSTIDWRQDFLTFGGKRVPIPRLQAWHGDADASYSYSGLALKPASWTETLLALKDQVENHSGYKFNSVLLNYYRDGRDSMSWHSDNEKELGQDPVIASLSFGQTRKFSLRHNQNKANKINIYLDDGCLLIMPKGLQSVCMHQLPKQPEITSGRINLTFRMIYGP